MALRAGSDEFKADCKKKGCITKRKQKIVFFIFLIFFDWNGIIFLFNLRFFNALKTANDRFNFKFRLIGKAEWDSIKQIVKHNNFDTCIR
jgi:hypothetical protein